jgi:NADH:ubiquinone oxidoreductase subunit 3 (subunit A)
MSDLILSPVIAFTFYMALVAILSLIGRAVAVRGKSAAGKRERYAGGEEHDSQPAAPGYRPFFKVALFFAVLHLGVLMIGTSGFSPFTGVYIGGLILALLALILG